MGAAVTGLGGGGGGVLQDAGGLLLLLLAGPLLEGEEALVGGVGGGLVAEGAIGLGEEALHGDLVGRGLFGDLEVGQGVGGLALAKQEAGAFGVGLGDVGALPEGGVGLGEGGVGVGQLVERGAELPVVEAVAGALSREGSGRTRGRAASRRC